MKMDRVFLRVFAPAIAGSLALHALALAAALPGSGTRPANDDVVAIVEFVPPAAANAPPLAPDFVPLAEEAPPPEFKPVEVRLPPPEEPPPLDLLPPKASPPPPAPRVVSRPPQVASRQPIIPRASPEPKAIGAAPSAATAAPGFASNWNALMSAWLTAHRNYPTAALRRAEQGDVSVRFTVSRDGHVSDVALMAGSGHADLDAAALALLRGATVPAPGVDATRTVSIRYRLTD